MYDNESVILITNSVLFDVRDSTIVVVDSGDNGINYFVTINTGVLSDGGESCWL